MRSTAPARVLIVAPPGLMAVDAFPARSDRTRARLERELLRFRKIALPLATAWGLLIAFLDPEPWRWGILAFLLPSVWVFSVRRLGNARSRPGVNLAVVAAAQQLMALATGGLVSPALIASFLMDFTAALAGASVATRLALALLQIGSFMGFAAIQTSGWLDGFIPSPFMGMASIGPAVGPWVTAGLYAVLAILALTVGRRVGLGLEQAYTERLAEKEVTLHMLRGHADELMRMSSEVAHELKNPLASVKGLAALLEPSSAGRDHDRWRVLRGEVDRMQGVLEELLDFTRPLVPLRRRQIRADAILREVSELHVGMAVQAGVGMELLEGPSVSLDCDPQKLRQILTNLIQNALEVSPPESSLCLGVWPEDDQVRFEVWDSGPGLTASEAERCFGRGFTTKPDGTGIGLTLARAFARQHGGDIRLEAAPGGGCLALLRLPRAPRLAEAAP